MTITPFTTTPYALTNKFKKIVIDYINGSPNLKPLYTFSHNTQGLQQAIAHRTFTTAQRQVLVQGLTAQYKSLTNNKNALVQINKLNADNCFTVCTAHQPNIFTGYWYSIYKICQTIALCASLNKNYNNKTFVPVFYMGSEDADLDELGHLFFNDTHYNWQTTQTGAVGRMVVDDALLAIKATIINQIGHLPQASALINLLNISYTKGQTIAQASFILLHNIFEAFGLLILIPDAPVWKKAMLPIFKQEILQNLSELKVSTTSAYLAQQGYKPQAHARPINLFYLDATSRNLINKIGERYAIKDTLYTEPEILALLETNPKAFSPNVILRGVLQETILPNIAFIGGGGEIAYWLQLKDVFALYKVPYPLLLLRNSFSIITNAQWNKLQKAGVLKAQIFSDILHLKNAISKSIYGNMLELQTEIEAINQAYHNIKLKATEVDITLNIHADALQVKHINKIEVLQKKLVKAARNKIALKNNALDVTWQQLYPNGGLQERKENFINAYATMGNMLIESLIANSEGIATALRTLLVN